MTIESGVAQLESYGHTSIPKGLVSVLNFISKLTTTGISVGSIIAIVAQDIDQVVSMITSLKEVFEEFFSFLKEKILEIVNIIKGIIDIMHNSLNTILRKLDELIDSI